MSKQKKKWKYGVFFYHSSYFGHKFKIQNFEACCELLIISFKEHSHTHQWKYLIYRPGSKIPKWLAILFKLFTAAIFVSIILHIHLFQFMKTRCIEQPKIYVDKLLIRFYRQFCWARWMLFLGMFLNKIGVVQ